MTEPASRLWSPAKLGDVVTLKRGYDLPASVRQRGDVPIVSSSGITGYHNEAKQPGPGVVTGRYGTLGEVFYVEGEYWPLNTTLYAQDFRGNHPRFIAYLLQSLNLGASQGAAAVPGVNRNVLHQLPVLKPPVCAQQKIAAILSAYDNLIENNTRRIKILEEMAQRIYWEWFVEFRYPEHEGVPLVDSEIGSIPEGWEVKRLSEVVTTQYGYTESTSTKPIGPRFLRGMGINKTSFIDWSCVPYCPITDSDHVRYRLARGDVLVIRMADPGKVGIVERDVDAVFASYLIRLRPRDDQITPLFLFFYLSCDIYQGYVTGASTGTTRKSLSAPVMTAIDFAVPPSEMQSRFETQVTPIRDHLTCLLEANVNLRTARDLLLPRLISGEIDVEDLNIDTSGLAA